MPILTTKIITDFIVKNLGSYLFKKAADKGLEATDKTLRASMYKAVMSTLEEYEQKFPQENDGKLFPFYQSQHIVSELIAFRVMDHEEYDIEKLEESFVGQENIIPPTKQNIEDLYSIFIKYIDADKNLKKLEIKANFQSEIFVVSERVKDIQNTLENMLPLVGADLELQWRNRINTYRSTLAEFKPETALNLLDALSESFSESQSKPNTEFIAALEFERGRCLRLLAKKDDSCAAYIKAYKLNKESLKYLDQAAISYFKIGSVPQSIELGTELLESDEFNPTGWAIKVLNTPLTELDELVLKIPSSVKRNVTFQSTVFIQFKTDNKFEQLEKIYELGLIPKFTDYQTCPITIENYQEHLFWLESSVSEYIQHYYCNFHPGPVDRPKLVTFINELSQRVLEVIDRSEMERGFEAIRMLHAYTSYLLTGEKNNVKAMEALLPKVGDNPFYEIITANALQFEGMEAEAINILRNSTGIEPSANILYAFISRKINDREEYAKGIKKFMGSFTDVNTGLLEQLFDAMVLLRMDGTISGFTPEEFYVGKTFENDGIMRLLEAVSTALITQPNEDQFKILDELAEEFPDNYVQTAIASAFFFSGENLRAIAIFKKLELTGSESIDLLFYIHSLYQANTDQQILLSLLERWRKEFSYSYDFTTMELQLHIDLLDWAQCIEICQHGLSKNPNDEFLLTRYALSLYKQGAAESLDKLAAIGEKLSTFKFTQEENIGVTSDILVKTGNIKPAIELLFRYAKDPQNKRFRLAYIQACIPAGYAGDLGIFKEYDTVSEGNWVKYTKDNKQYIVALTPENLKVPLNAQLVGCGKHGGFTFKRPIFGEDLITIDRIMDQYLGLHDEIFLEIHQNPNSGMPAQSIQVNPNDPESISTLFKGIFGEKGSEEKQRKETELEHYYRNEISFSELVFSVYDGSYLSAYFNMVTSQKGINCLPIHLFKVKDNLEYVVDLSSLFILYQIHLQHGTRYNTTFILSGHIFEILKNELEKLKDGHPDDFSINVTKEEISADYNAETSRNSNILYLENLIKWISENCQIKVATRILEFTHDLHGRPGLMRDYIVNTVLLLEESPERLLIADDTFYFMFGVGTSKIISTEFYIKVVEDKSAEAGAEFIKNRYRGTTFGAENLNIAYDKKNEAGDSNYTYLLESLQLAINPLNIGPALEHIMHILRNGDNGLEEKKSHITAVFASLLHEQKVSENMDQMTAFVEEYFTDSPQEKEIVMNCLNNME